MADNADGAEVWAAGCVAWAHLGGHIATGLSRRGGRSDSDNDEGDGVMWWNEEVDVPMGRSGSTGARVRSPSISGS